MGDRRSTHTGRRPRWGLVVVAAVVFAAPLVVVLATLALPALAQVGTLTTTQAASFGFGTNTDVRLIIIRVVQFLLGFLGLLAIIIVLYGGYLWMTAAGNEQRVEEAQQVLRRAIIGAVIILASYSITQFIIFRLSLETR